MPKQTKAKRKAIRRILDGDIFFLSLVDVAANESEILLKGKNLQEIKGIAKLSREGLLHTLVWGPDQVDCYGDTADGVAVKKLCHRFIPSMVGSGIDVMHNCQPVDERDAHVCESFMIQKNGDDRFKGVKVNGRVIEDTTELEGWWAAIIKLNAPELRAPFESGDWTGVSMFGDALVETVSKSDFTSALADRLGSPPNPEETDMDPQELIAALTQVMSPMMTQLEKISKSVVKEDVIVPTPDKLEKDLPVFDGDPNDLEEIEAHEELLFKTKLDFSDMKDLAKWKTYLAKKAADAKAAKDAEDSTDSVELKKAKADVEAANRKVTELSKASNQSADDIAPSTENANDKMARLMKRGRETSHNLLVSQGRRTAKAE